MCRIVLQNKELFCMKSSCVLPEKHKGILLTCKLKFLCLASWWFISSEVSVKHFAAACCTWNPETQLTCLLSFSPSQGQLFPLSTLQIGWGKSLQIMLGKSFNISFEMMLMFLQNDSHASSFLPCLLPSAPKCLSVAHLDETLTQIALPWLIPLLSNLLPLSNYC